MNWLGWVAAPDLLWMEFRLLNGIDRCQPGDDGNGAEYQKQDVHTQGKAHRLLRDDPHAFTLVADQLERLATARVQVDRPADQGKMRPLAVVQQHQQAGERQGPHR